MPDARVDPLPTRLPLVAEPENRDDDASKDAKIINSFIERAKDGSYWWYKRAGLGGGISRSAAAGLGTYNWKGDLYSITGTTLYKNTTSIGTVNATNGVYRFSATLGATPYLVLGDGVKAYTYNGSVFAQITDGDFPSSFVKGWSFLDATTYVMNSSASIQGSGLNDPTSWDPLNVIIAQSEPDGGVALAKQLVYTIAFKQWTTEVFYDAANATGSPLGTVPGARVNFGSVSADSMQSVDDILLWISANRTALPSVMLMDNLKVRKVSTKQVDRLLAAWDYTTIFSWVCKDEGHRLYGITSKVSNMTLVYDLDEDRWYQWTDASGNYWPIVSMSYVGTTRYAQHETNGKIYVLDRSYTSDDGSVFPCDLYTSLFDGGIDRRKVCNLMHLEGDRTEGSVIQMRVSDDDYRTWSGWRQFDMSQPRPMVTGLGTFYRRAHHFRHQCNTRLRARAGDWQLELGTA